MEPFPGDESLPFPSILLPIYFPVPIIGLRPVLFCCPPQAGKMFNYTHWRKVCDTLFIIFSLVFFYTRLVLFPTQ